jgi:cytochrome P450
VAADNGVPLEDNARYDVGGSIALLVNTVPATFWTLMFMYSHPGLLEDIRKELDPVIEESTKNGQLQRLINITKVKEQCPLLISMYQETLRHRGMGTAVREVTEDTYLNQWLLKKGAMVQMPGRIIHLDADLWGPNVTEFQPRRFLKEEKRNGPGDVCFRAFGGGKTLCPGRHFATNEIIAIVALFALRFDMKPSSGEWTFPTVEKTAPIATLLEPDTDVDVDISLRKGFEEGIWAIGATASSKVLNMVAEDK